MPDLTPAELEQILDDQAEEILETMADYDEEELKRITPPNAELLKLADRNPPPQEWFDEEGEDLFV